MTTQEMIARCYEMFEENQQEIEEMHKKLDDLEAGINHLEKNIQDFKKDVEQTETFLKGFKNEKQTKKYGIHINRNCKNLFDNEEDARKRFEELKNLPGMTSETLYLTEMEWNTEIPMGSNMKIIDFYNYCKTTKL